MHGSGQWSDNQPEAHFSNADNGTSKLVTSNFAINFIECLNFIVTWRLERMFHRSLPAVENIY
jgi:hypothetical protein